MLQNNFAIALRKRTPWESVDLGFKLMTNYFKAVFLPWLTLFILMTVPLFSTLYNYPLLIVYITFIMMPLLERSCLFVLSRAVFGNVPTYKETLKSWSKQCKTGWLAHTVFLRFSPARAFHLPVYQLENLKGFKNKQRRKVLARGNGALSLNTTFLFSLFETMIIFGIFTFLKDFIPADYLSDLLEDFQTTGTFDNNLVLVFIGIYLVTVAFLRPFYIACNFSLYLNRRMELEGWDIELAFRKMAKRLQAKNVIMLLTLFLFTCFSMNSFAQENVLTNRFHRRYSSQSGVENPKKVIEEVMKTKEFNRKKTIKRLKRIGETEEKEAVKEVDTIPSSVAYEAFMLILKILIISALVVTIAIAVYIFIANRRLSDGAFNPDKKVKPATIMGFAIEEKTLPKNLAEEAMALWKKGEIRAAYSLLYRGTLSKLVNNYDIDLKDSFTEGDCVRAVKKISEAKVASFFSSLTRSWCILAYAHITPSDNFTKMCSDFNNHFEEKPEVSS